MSFGEGRHGCLGILDVYGRCCGCDGEWFLGALARLYVPHTTRSARRKQSIGLSVLEGCSRAGNGETKGVDMIVSRTRAVVVWQ